VLKAIASIVPADFELMVIFENWNTESSLPLLKLGSTLKGDFFTLPAICDHGLFCLEPSIHSITSYVEDIRYILRL